LSSSSSSLSSTKPSTWWPKEKVIHH
jgi:hypothetical protein